MTKPQLAFIFLASSAIVFLRRYVEWNDVYSMIFIGLLALIVGMIASLRYTSKASSLVLIVFPFAMVGGLTFIRHEFGAGISDLAIWASGLASAVICFGLWSLSERRLY